MAKAFTGFTAAGSVAADDILLIAQLSSTVTITASTISAAASDNSFNDSGSGFVTAGFAVGDRVKITGFTGDTANNIFEATVTALTSAKMTIGGTDGDVIVDDAAGESVTIAKWVTRRCTVSDLPSNAYDFATPYFSGQPTASEILARIPIMRDITIAADFDGWHGYDLAADPAATFEIDVQVDGTSIGTVSIATDGAFTFATASNTAKSVSANSLLTFVAPSTADTSIDGIQIGCTAELV